MQNSYCTTYTTLVIERSLFYSLFDLIAVSGSSKALCVWLKMMLIIIVSHSAYRKVQPIFYIFPVANQWVNEWKKNNSNIDKQIIQKKHPHFNYRTWFLSMIILLFFSDYHKLHFSSILISVTTFVELESQRFPF
jgi:hypothetical protein